MARFNEQLILKSSGLGHQASVGVGHHGAVIADREYGDRGVTASRPMRRCRNIVKNTEPRIGY